MGAYSNFQNSWRRASEHLAVRRAERDALHFIDQEQLKLLKRCAARIAFLEDANMQLKRAIYGWQNEALTIAEAWRIAMETPELDVRDEVDELIVHLRDKTCAAAEFVT